MSAPTENDSCATQERRISSCRDVVDWSFSTRHVDARLIDPGDRELYRTLYADPQVMMHVGPVLDGGEADALFAKVLAWNSETPMRARYWRLGDKNSGVAVGVSALVRHAGGYEIGLMILPSWQRSGIGLPVTAHIRDAAMAGPWGLQIRTLTLQPRIANVASRRLCEQLGFRLADADSERIYWRLTREDWSQWQYE